VLCMCTILART